MPNYATVAQLRAFKVAGATIDLSAYSDAELGLNLDIAESIVESYTNTIFYQITQSIYFNGNGNQNLYVAQILNYPIISASACTDVDENDVVFHTYEEGPDFIVQPWYLAKTWNNFSARLSIGSSGPTWPKGFRNIKVTGDWGYAEVPVAVTRATLLIAAEISKPGSSGLLNTNIAKQRWDDYEVQFKGLGQNPPEPSDTTGFDFIDRLLDKWRFKPDLFLTPDAHMPAFTGHTYVY